MVEILTIVIVIVFLLAIVISYFIGFRSGAFNKHKEWEQVLMPEHRKDAIERSRSVIGGHFSENLAPYLPDFPYLPTECRFLGKPTDFIVFKGMDEKDINEVVFVEVKSGKSKLNSQERKLKETIDKKKVKFEEYRIPEDITKKKDIEEY
jgi:predicted Holliday junction resolvase-like endonuclease